MNCKYLKDGIYCNYPDEAVRKDEAPDGVCFDEAHNCYSCGLWEEGPADGWARSDQVVTKLDELEQ
jgi:sugar lactone lactonase YvrE